MRSWLALFFLILAVSVSAQDRARTRRYAPEVLREDFIFLRKVLGQTHPGLYSYTPPEKLNTYFTWAYNSITDSMTEVQFRNLLSFAVSKIRCGHTVVKPSKSYSKGGPDRSPVFPFQTRVWKDSLVVTYSRFRGDSALPRGTVITSVNGKPVPEILSSLYEFMSTDGYSIGVNEIRLSYSFPSYYRSVFGSSEKFEVGYINDSGVEEKREFCAYVPPAPDSTQKKEKKKEKVSARKTRAKAREDARSMRIDSITGAPIVEINTFMNGFRLPKFYRQTFRHLRKNNSENLIIDIRDNGGGNIRNYILLAKYLKKGPFGFADSVIAVTAGLPTKRYIEGSLLNDLYIKLFTHKGGEGNHHFTYFENKVFRPKKKNHYDGQIYIITSGQTFSAATLFASTLKGQENCLIVGEETGGGAYSNNGMLIPELTLPRTKVRVTLPLFRIVIDSNRPNDGRGILPDVEVLPSTESIRRGIDSKLTAVQQRIIAGL